MRLFEVINTVWGVDVLASTRNQENTFARYQAYDIMRNDYQMTLAEISEKFDKHHATIISGLKRFQSLIIYDKEFQDKYKLVRIMLTNAKEELIKPISENPLIRDIVLEMEDMTDEELMVLFTRVEIYKKSVIYNRKKKKEWERPKQQA